MAGGKTKNELLVEVEDLRTRLTAAERDCQILVDGLKEERRAAEAQWQQRVEELEAQVAEYAAAGNSPVSAATESDSEREALLATVQEQAEELAAANEELRVQTEELQGVNEELTIQAEELRVANEELQTLNQVLGGQKKELWHLTQELETERALLVAVLDQMPASVVIAQAPAGPILLSNLRAEMTWDKPLKELADLEDFWQIPRFAPDGHYLEKSELPLWRSLTTGEVVLNEEFLLKPPGGRPKHLSVSSAPVRDRQGRVVAGVVTHADITARVKAEETLRASEARYRNLVQLSPNAIMVHTEGRIVFLNMAAVKLFRASVPGDLLGQDILNLVGPDYREVAAQRIKLAQAGSKTEPREIQLLRLDGTAVDAEVMGSGIVFHGKSSVQVIFQDITERKQAEAERERLLAERDRAATQLEAVLNSMSEGLIIADLDGNILAMNNASLALHGFKSLKEIQRHISEFPEIIEVRKLSGEVLPVEKWPLARALRGGTFSDTELRLRRLDLAREFICSYSGGPVLGKDGRAILAIVTVQDITPRKRIEEALRQREAQLQTILENVTEGVVVADLDSHLFHWNSAAVAMHGFASLEECQRHLPELAEIFEMSTAADGILPVEQWPMGRILNGETLRNWEVNIKRLHNGWQRTFSYSGTLAHDANGQPLLAVVSISDITERKAAEVTLRESREDLNRAQAVAHIGSWRLDVQHDALAWSDETYHIFGMSPGSQLNYETFLGLVHPEDREYVNQKWGAALQGVPYDLEHRIVVDDTVKWVREKAELDFDQRGRLLGGFGTVQDITERKRAEAALKESEERYRSLFQGSQAVMLLINPDNGTIMDANPAACSYYGYTREELTAKLIKDINLWPAEQVMAEIQRARAGKSGQCLFQHRLADGAVRDVEVFSSAIHFHGKILLYAIVHDITERKIVEAERQNLLIKLQESHEELEVINEELQLQTEELQAQAEELREANQALVTAHVALSESEARFRGLFDSMTEGVALHEIIYNDRGSAVDYRIIAANPAFSAHTGIEADRIRGRLASTVYGAGEAPFLEIYAHVAQTATPATFETFFPPLERYFYISATSPKTGQFITVFEDITARKRMEKDLRYSNQRLDLLAETAGQLLASESPQRVVDTLCHRVMDFLDCQAFFNFLVDEDAGRLHLNACAGIPEEEAKRIEWLDYGVAVCGCAARDGCRIITENIQTTPDPRTELVKSFGIRAYACHPLLIQGQVLGTLSFGTRTRDHFSPDDLALMKAVTNQVAVAMARKLAEEALKASEERERARAAELQAVLDTVPAIIWLAHDPDSQIITGNPAAYELLRIPSGQNMSKTASAGELPSHFKVLQDGKEIPSQELPVQRAAAGQTVRDFEIDLVFDEGTTYNLLGNAVPLREPNGELRGAVAAFIDVTARRRIEEALRRARDELEQRVQERTAELRHTVAQLIEEVQERQQAQEALRKQAELLELAHEAIIVRDLDSRVIFWNQGAEEKYGWTREQALGQVIHDLLASRFPRAREEIDQELKETGHWQGELVHTRANGREIVVSSRQALQRDDQGKPVAILEINRDVTARRQAEEALQIERQRLLAVLERIPAHVALLRADHSFTYVNGEYLRRFGEPEDKRCYENIGKNNPCVECPAQKVFQDGQPIVREWLGPDGNFYQMCDYPFMDVDGSPLVLEMGVDITPLKRAEEQALNLGRRYRMVSKVNEAMVRARGNKEELFRQVCRIMMAEGDFLLAWIGLVDPDSRMIKAAAEYDLNDAYVQNIKIPYDDVPKGRGPTGTAVREGRLDVCNDIATDPRLAPWREQALARGFLASAAFPLRVGKQVVGALTVYASSPGFFNADEISLLEPLADDLSFALDFMDKEAKRRQTEAALQESEERLRYLASQLLHTQESERRRLALELHDDLGQSLMVLKLQLRAIERMVPADQWRTREECGNCLNYLNGVIDNVRRLARDLRPAVLEDLGLCAGLRLLAGDFCTYHDVELCMEIDDIEGLFSQEAEINIYRIFQETLTNIAKHAGARRIDLAIARQEEAVVFKVVDDGMGFDLEKVLSRAPTKKGLGLAALQERVHMLRGELTITSHAPGGTEISFRLPVSGLGAGAD